MFHQSVLLPELRRLYNSNFDKSLYLIFKKKITLFPYAGAEIKLK